MQSDKASIEDFIGEVKVDFANKFIGGGALHSGCVQEEIMFTNHPEILTSTIFCEVMN
jgi:poly(ADP-ribose) glycohydrolase